jgi:hypothetical protein
VEVVEVVLRAVELATCLTSFRGMADGKRWGIGAVGVDCWLGSLRVGLG